MLGHFSSLTLRRIHLALRLQIISRLCYRSQLLEAGYAFLVGDMHTAEQYKELYGQLRNQMQWRIFQSAGHIFVFTRCDLENPATLYNMIKTIVWTVSLQWMLWARSACSANNKRMFIAQAELDVIKQLRGMHSCSHRNVNDQNVQVCRVYIQIGVTGSSMGFYRQCRHDRRKKCACTFRLTFHFF